MFIASYPSMVRKRAIHGSEPETGGNSLLHETVVLLQHIIQVGTRPASALPAQLTTFLQFRDGRRVGRMPVDIDHARSNLPGSPHRHQQEVLGGNRIPLGRQHEIDGLAH
jgi:hypothetical protein